MYPQAPKSLVEPLLVPSDDGHIGTLGEEKSGEGEPEAARAAYPERARP